jgi:magnesium chelatase family protein
VHKYLNKVSGPLLDRIDIHIEVTPVSFDQLSGERTAEKSEDIRKRVVIAREIQTERFKESGTQYCNAQLTNNQVQELCKLNPIGQKLLKTAMERLQLSARAYDRILKVSRTIADLANSETILPEHVAEAIQFRSLDRENWAG